MSEISTKFFLGNIEIVKSFLGNEEILLNPTRYVEAIPTNGLVAYYTVNNPNSWPGSGTTWFDISGNNNDMIPVSSSVFPTYDATNFAFNFNKTNQAIFGQQPITSITSSQSHVSWVKPGETGAVNVGVYTGIQNNAGGGVTGKFDAESYGDQGTGWTLASSNLERTVSSGDTEATAEFVCIVSVRDSTSFRIYRNGVEIASQVRALFNYSAGAFPYVGNRFLNNSVGNWTAGAFFTGSLSNYAVYNRALNLGEIQDIYNLDRLNQ